jgi:cell division protein FtsB
MRIFIAILILLFVWLQYKLWYTDGGLLELWSLKQTIAEQQNTNAALEAKNKVLAAEVEDLKLGTAAIEERARDELGMIKEEETFYQIVDGKTDANHSSQQ